MSLQVSRSGTPQEFPLRGTAAILDEARKKRYIEPAPSHPKVPNVIAGLVASFFPLNGRKEITQKLCHAFQINSGLPSILASANKIDTLEAQEKELARLLDDYKTDPVKYPLPVNGRNYTAPVSIVLNDSQQVSVKVLNFLKQACPNMRALRIEFFLFPDNTSESSSDDVLRVVASCTSLKRLSIHYGYNYTRQGLLSLCGLKQLEAFAIAITQDQFAPESIAIEDAKQLLSALSGLKELDLLGLDMESTEAFMNALEGCPDLECISLNRLDERSIMLIKRLAPCLTKLRKCVLTDESELTVEGARALKSCKGLESLITKYSLTVETVRELVELKNLHTLHIEGVTEKVQSILPSFSKLSNLKFTCVGTRINRYIINRLTEEALRAFAEQMPQLRELFIRDIPLTAVNAIGSFTNLEALTLFIGSGVRKINYEIPGTCFDSLKNLKKLCLVDLPESGCNGVAGLDGVSAGLQELTINIPYFSERLTEALARFQRLKKLLVVITAYGNTTSQIKEDVEANAVDVNDVFARLAPSWTKLTDLEVISGIIGLNHITQIFHETVSPMFFVEISKIGVTTQGLDALLQMPRLARMNCNWSINMDNLRTFAAQHPQLKQVDGSPISRFDDETSIQNAAEESVTLKPTVIPPICTEVD